jgi:hypothetical protein
MEPTPKIKLPVPYKPHEKIDNKLKSLNKTGTKKILTFIGSNEVEAMFYLYLFKKYKSNCFLHDKNSERRILGISILINEKYEPRETKEIEEQLKNLSKILLDCLKNLDTKIIIIPVQLIFDDGGAHANLLIYRKNLNQIEHFEPHGKNFSRKQENINKIIEKWMKYFVLVINARLLVIKKPQIKFIESSEVCPYIDGFQNLEAWSNLTKIAGVEPGGYCSAWSMFFTELCLKNPEIPSSTLINYVFNTLELMDNMEKRNYLKSVIRGYSVFVNEKIDKYFSVFFKNGLTIKKIKKFSYPQLINLENILKNLVNLEMNLSTNPLYLQTRVETIENEMKKLYADLEIMNKNNIYNPDILKQIDELMDKKNDDWMYNVFNRNKISSPTASNSPRLSSTNNRLKLLKTCPEGKEINPKTGRCVKTKVKKVKLEKTKTKKVKLEKVKSLKQKVEPVVKTCPEGKELNLKTGRCIKIKTQKIKKVKTPKMKTPKVKLEKIPKICPEGKEINPKTGRCVKTKVKKVKLEKTKTRKQKIKAAKDIEEKNN